MVVRFGEMSKVKKKKNGREGRGGLATLPARGEVELVGVVSHVVEVGEAVEVDDRGAGLVVILHARGRVRRATGLPVVWRGRKRRMEGWCFETGDEASID